MDGSSTPDTPCFSPLNHLMTLTAEEIQNNRERIEALLKSTGREGIDKVLEYLDKQEFYQIPSSLSRHHNWTGGLAQHCLGVYDRLKKTGEDLPQDSIAIVSLLHDICKARKFYRNRHGDWAERRDDELHYKGHGNRSVKLLENTCGLHLTQAERNAIRWHMGGYNLPKEEMREFYANKNNDLWRLLYNADRFNASKNT